MENKDAMLVYVCSGKQFPSIWRFEVNLHSGSCKNYRMVSYELGGQWVEA